MSTLCPPRYEIACSNSMKAKNFKSWDNQRVCPLVNFKIMELVLVHTNSPGHQVIEIKRIVNLMTSLDKLGTSSSFRVPYFLVSASSFWLKENVENP